LLCGSSAGWTGRRKENNQQQNEADESSHKTSL
jgi:hypothetical protein